jgi:hypothetical protein
MSRDWSLRIAPLDQESRVHCGRANLAVLREEGTRPNEPACYVDLVAHTSSEDRTVFGRIAKVQSSEDRIVFGRTSKVQSRLTGCARYCAERCLPSNSNRQRLRPLESRAVCRYGFRHRDCLGLDRVGSQKTASLRSSAPPFQFLSSKL